MDLYETLGVEKGSPKQTIRKAYRKAAKKAHPDAGGSREKFALIKLAHDTLSDDGKRAKYDRDGTIDEGVKKSIEQRALEMAFRAVEDVVTTIITKFGGHVGEFDIIKDAKIRLLRDKTALQQQIKDGERLVAIRNKTAARFRAKKGKENLISRMMENQTNGMIRNIEGLKENCTLIQMSIAVLDDHTFDVELATSTPYGDRLAAMGLLGMVGM
jgi:curved DNA-binding protein CbpA